jgi:hypothetical protein
MSARRLLHNNNFIFDGTNYDIWKTCMLNHFRDMDPNIERILDMSVSPPKDSQSIFRACTIGALSPGARVKFPAVTSDSQHIPIRAWELVLRRHKIWSRTLGLFSPE